MAECEVLYEGILEIKCGSREEALRNLADEVGYFLHALCHHLDPFLDIMKESYYGEGEEEKFIKTYRELQKHWINNAEWKERLQNQLERAIRSLCVPENYDFRSKTYKCYYDGGLIGYREFLESHWWFIYEPSIVAGNNGIEQREIVPYIRLNKFQSQIDDIMNRFFRFDKGEGATMVFNNLCNSPSFPKSDSIFKSRYFNVRCEGEFILDFNLKLHQFKMRRAIRENQKKADRSIFLGEKTSWTPDDYALFPLFQEERVFLAKLSTIIQRYIPVYDHEEEEVIFWGIENQSTYAVMLDVQSENPAPTRVIYHTDGFNITIPPIRKTGLNVIGLYLSNLELKEIPLEISHFKYIRFLNVSHNFLEDLPLWLTNLRALQHADCTRNPFTDIPVVFFMMVRENGEYILDLDDNPPLISFDDPLFALTERNFFHQRWTFSDLQYRVENNLGLIFTDVFHSEIVARELDIKILIQKGEQNPTKEHLKLLLDERLALVEIGKVTGISLNGSLLEGNSPFGGTNSVYHITFLLLENMNLTSIPRKVFDLPYLQYLSLAGNPLTEIPIDIVNLKDLNQLNIKNTLVSEFPLILFENPRKIHIDFDGLQLNDQNTGLFNQHNNNNLKSYIHTKYRSWDMEQFLEKIAKNIPADIVDKTYPKLDKIRDLLESNLREIDTNASKKFQAYLFNRTKILSEDNDYPIYL